MVSLLINYKDHDVKKRKYPQSWSGLDILIEGIGYGMMAGGLIYLLLIL